MPRPGEARCLGTQLLQVLALLTLSASLPVTVTLTRSQSPHERPHDAMSARRAFELASEKSSYDSKLPTGTVRVPSRRFGTPARMLLQETIATTTATATATATATTTATAIPSSSSSSGSGSMCECHCSSVYGVWNEAHWEAVAASDPWLAIISEEHQVNST